MNCVHHLKIALGLGQYSVILLTEKPFALVKHIWTKSYVLLEKSKSLNCIVMISFIMVLSEDCHRVEVLQGDTPVRYNSICTIINSKREVKTIIIFSKQIGRESMIIFHYLEYSMTTKMQLFWLFECSWKVRTAVM